MQRQVLDDEKAIGPASISRCMLSPLSPRAKDKGAVLCHLSEELPHRRAVRSIYRHGIKPRQRAADRDDCRIYTAWDSMYHLRLTPVVITYLVRVSLLRMVGYQITIMII